VVRAPALGADPSLQSLDRLRKEIEPVAAADFLRFLFKWKRLATGSRAKGRRVWLLFSTCLDGYELAAGAWEVRSAAGAAHRLRPALARRAVSSGEIAVGTADGNAEHGSRNAAQKVGPVKSTPIALFRANAARSGERGIPRWIPQHCAVSTGKALLGAFRREGATSGFPALQISPRSRRNSAMGVLFTGPTFLCRVPTSVFRIAVSRPTRSRLTDTARRARAGRNR